MRVVDCVAAFLAAKSAENLRPASLSNYARELKRFTVLCEVVDADDIDVSMVRAYLARLLADGSKSSSVAQARLIVLLWLDWLGREGYIDARNWRAEVPPVRTDERRPDYLTQEEAKRLLECAGKGSQRGPFCRRRNPALIAMLLDTGLRKGELAALKLEDVDLTTRSVRVSEECKGRRFRLVFFGSDTLRLLRPYLKERERRFGLTKTWLWVTSTGRRLSAGSIYALVKAAAKLAGLGNVYPHSLRHTMASLCADNGMDPFALQQLLGHRRLETTMRYVHLGGRDLHAKFDRCSPVSRLLREE
jgi:site-specific recombinase XerD